MNRKMVMTRILWALIGFSGLSNQMVQAELVGYWTFDDDVLDKSGKGNHGELIDAVYSPLVPAAIGSGKSVQFSSDAEHVFIEENPSLDSEVFTLTMFIYDHDQQLACDEAGTRCAMERLTSRNADVFETALNLHPPFSGEGGLSFYSPTSNWQRSEEIPPINRWLHVAFVADGEIMTTYADGVVVDERPFQAAPTGFMHIGNRWNNVEGFDGNIDEVAMWDEVLPTATIAALASGARRPNGQVRPLGDFDGNGRLESEDIDILARAIQDRSTEARFDLDGNSKVESADHLHWVVRLKKTYLGDANLDGEFNSNDFVTVFVAGQYEDALAANSMWKTGDWNGDLEFNSSDFVAAFVGGGYEQGPRPAAVPESGCSVWLLVIGMGCLRRRRHGDR